MTTTNAHSVRLSAGTDIASIERMMEASRSERFLARVFTPVELAGMPGGRGRARYLAAVFASKEAFMKALSTGLSGGLAWQDIEVERPLSARPALRVRGAALQRLAGRRAFLTAAAAGGYAVASVVLEG